MGLPATKNKIVGRSKTKSYYWQNQYKHLKTKCPNKYYNYYPSI